MVNATNDSVVKANSEADEALRCIFRAISRCLASKNHSHHRRLSISLRSNHALNSTHRAINDIPQFVVGMYTLVVPHFIRSERMNEEEMEQQANDDRARARERSMKSPGERAKRRRREDAADASERERFSKTHTHAIAFDFLKWRHLLYGAAVARCALFRNIYRNVTAMLLKP